MIVSQILSKFLFASASGTADRLIYDLAILNRLTAG